VIFRLLIGLLGVLLVGCGNGDSAAPPTSAAGAPSTDTTVVDPPTTGVVTTTTVDVWTSLPPPGAGDRLAVVADHGGRCPGGTCFQVLELLPDGQWQLTDGSGAVIADGSYDQAVLVDLIEGVTPDPGVLTLGPFHGHCPTMVDGQERFYRIHDPADPSVVVAEVSTCSDQVDADAPLVVALDLLMADAGSAVD
jgi:hypothetical protein